MSAWSVVVDAIGADLLATAAFVVVAAAGIVVPLVSIAAFRNYARRAASLPAIARLDHLDGELERRRLQLSSLEQQVDTTKAALDDLEPKRGELLHVEERIRLAREEWDDVRERLASLEPTRMELGALEAQRDGVRKQVDEILASKVDAEARLREVEATMQATSEALDRARKEVSAANAATEAAQERTKAAQAELATLQRSRTDVDRELDVLRRDADDVRKEIERRRQELASVEKELNEARSKDTSVRTVEEVLDTLMARAATPDQATRDAARADLYVVPPTFAKSNLTTAARAPQERAALDELERQLKDDGFVFSRRRIDAFHTALKVSDISPLTVLAGISGTGKSELPRRYALSMGMHFLQMPVQPRWDSPQDLFGFYNFLEKRYVGTDLARALISMDRFNHADRSTTYGDRMLMVLLDEMNLARVEYYFSEFLSRLEVRRSVDVDDPASRRDAEIVLEAGGGASAEDVRIYVAPNVLFVGTMNEDESTQTLSDKVIDRANVMRFGRPTATHGATTRAPANVRSEYLPFAAWKTWQRTSDDLSDVHRTEIREWTSKLNRAMDDLGRPFGHRVSQAIEAYVVNHPSYQTTDGVRTAFADQMELRILPKLRGVEVDPPNDDAFGEIASLVAEVGDEALARSIRDGMDLGGPFQWRGLDRQDDA